jgi:hypothetical protein
VDHWTLTSAFGLSQRARAYRARLCSAVAPHSTPLPHSTGCPYMIPLWRAVYGVGVSSLTCTTVLCSVVGEGPARLITVWSLAQRDVCARPRLPARRARPALSRAAHTPGHSPHSTGRHAMARPRCRRCCAAISAAVCRGGVVRYGERVQLRPIGTSIR